MGRLVLGFAALALALVSSPRPASGDAVPPAPADCPVGSSGTTSHTDTYCMPSSCTASTDCTPPSGVGTPGELFCTPNLGLCLETRTAIPGGRPLPGPPPGPISYDVAHGPCATDADCAAPARCVVMSRCAPAPAPAAVVEWLGCSSSPHRSGPPGGVLASAALLGLARSVRRRRVSVA